MSHGLPLSDEKIMITADAAIAINRPIPCEIALASSSDFVKRDVEFIMLFFLFYGLL